MIIPDTSAWTHVGDAGNSSYYEVEPRILAAVPSSGASDTGATARVNIAFQNAQLAKMQGGVVMIFFDRLVSQDKAARHVYQTEPDPKVFYGAALIGGSLLSRAMGSFFLGLSKPTVRLKMFASMEEALVWARELILARGESK